VNRVTALRLAVAAALVLALSLAAASTGGARDAKRLRINDAPSWDVPAWSYTHNSCDGDPNLNRVDPVNFVMYQYGTIGRVTNQVHYHTTAHWSDTGGSSQYFGEHTGGCWLMDAQQASGNVWESRYHIRWHAGRSNGGYDPNWGNWSVGDAHHEDLVVACPYYPGHAVDQNGPNGSGFDQGRRKLRQDLEAGGHYWSSVWWGNTQGFTQCDGGVASSDGYNVHVYTHAYNH
jgi:hypothetical protein